MRYKVLDALRGFAVLNMILYHGLWDMVCIFGADIGWYTSKAGFIWQQCICYTFILLSGFCLNLSRNKLKRGITVFAASILITIVTAFAMPENIIVFGTLCLIGSAMILTIPCDKAFKKINPIAGVVISLCIFVATRMLSLGKLPVGYVWGTNLFTAYLGFPSMDFVSADYFPLVPWLFLFWCGYFLHRVFEKADWLKCFSALKCPPLEWVGRHSLIIYLLHQPVIYVVLFILKTLF